MKRLIKPLLFLAVFQLIMMVLGRALRGRFLSQEIGEGEINAIGVTGGAEEKVTSTDFRGGYLKAIMGGVELDLTEATVENPPATLETTVVMGGAEIRVPEGWKVKIDTQTILGGVHNDQVNEDSDEDDIPDLVLTGKVVLGGIAIKYKKIDKVEEPT